MDKELKFKNTAEKFQDILDYYVQNEIFSKRSGTKWYSNNKFPINTFILKKCFKTDNIYEIWRRLIKGETQFLSLVFLKKGDANYPRSASETLTSMKLFQYNFEDFYPTITIGYLPQSSISLFSLEEADYMWDTFTSLEKSKKQNIFEYANLPWKCSRMIKSLIYMINLKLKELNEQFPD